MDNIVIDPRHVVRTIPADFFGINYVGFWDSAAGSRASARALAQTPIKTVRFPGGAPADWYDWQNPYYKGWSRTSPLRLWHYVRSFGGTHVIFGTNYQGHQPDPPGKSYAVNSPQNAAAWVRYDKKVGIRAVMEVGNEEDMTLLRKTDDPAYGAYIARFNAQATAMHRANPRVRVLGPAGTNEYYWWTLDGLGMFLRRTGNRTGTGQVDGISLHFYKGTSWSDSKNVAQYWLAPNGPWAAIQKMIRAHDTRKLPVSITEWNAGTGNGKDTFNGTIGHALVIADMAGAFALSGAQQQDYFDIHGANGWGLLYGTGEARPVDTPTPTYYAMALWKHMGNRMLRVRQSDNAGSTVSTYAAAGKNGSMQVLAINKKPTAQEMRMQVQGASLRGHRLRVYSLRGRTRSITTGDAVYDGREMPSPARSLPGPMVTWIPGRKVDYRVPGYSAVVLDLASVTKTSRSDRKVPGRTL